MSFEVRCEDQAEIDHYWERLVEGGGEHGPCGWLKDRYGRSWQVTPVGMEELFSDPDTSKADRAFKAMMQMSKIDVEAIRRAAEGEAAPSS